MLEMFVVYSICFFFILPATTGTCCVLINVGRNRGLSLNLLIHAGATMTDRYHDQPDW